LQQKASHHRLQTIPLHPVYCLAIAIKYKKDLIHAMLHSANYCGTLGSNASLYPMEVTLLLLLTVLLLFDTQYAAKEYLSFEASYGQHCECHW
jgi:hypothetical protein